MVYCTKQYFSERERKVTWLKWEEKESVKEMWKTQWDQWLRQTASGMWLENKYAPRGRRHTGLVVWNINSIRIQSMLPVARWPALFRPEEEACLNPIDLLSERGVCVWGGSGWHTRNFVELMGNCWFLKQTHPRDLFQFKLVTEFFLEMLKSPISFLFGFSRKWTGFFLLGDHWTK